MEDMVGLTFDSSITAGAVLNAAVLIVGITIAFTRVGGRIDLLGQRLEALEKIVIEMVQLDKRFATFEERVVNHGTQIVQLQRDINDLKRGKGWITQNRQSVDGEYE